MGTVFQDLKYALRVLGRNPGFTAVAVLTLALGIGADTAIFTVLNAVVLRPLPYKDPSHLVLIWTEFKQGGQGRLPASGMELVRLRERGRQFDDIAGIWVGNSALTGVGEPEQVKLGVVTWNFLSLFGIRPQLGRLFLSNEEGSGAARSVVLSDALWRRRFGADPQILGRSLRLSGTVVTVVGVMPKDFEVIFPNDASVPPDVQAWTPFPYDLIRLPPDLNYIRMVGRLRPGATVAQAQSEASGIAQQLRSEFKEFSTTGLGLQIVKLQEDSTRDIRPTLVALFAGVGMILVIACANVASLLLARASARQREITLRSALGAARIRIVRQLLTESVLLSCLGCLASLAVGWGGLKALLALRPAKIARIQSIQLDFASLAFAFAVALISGVVFGLAPVFASMKVDLMETLKAGGISVARSRHYSQRALVAGEVALGLVLLVGATLLIRTFKKLVNVDPGFRSGHVLTFQVSPPGTRYKTDESIKKFFRELEKKVDGLPGVQSVGASSHLPFDDYPNWYEYYWREGATVNEQNTLMADHRAILPGYFQAIGATLEAGRDFDLSDDPRRPNVIIVDEPLARRTWPNESALGKKLNVGFIHNGSFDRTWAEVVGVVRHISYESLTAEVRGQVYVPYFQSARERLGFVVRTSGDPRSLIGPIRRQLDTLDKDVPLAKVLMLDEYLTQARAAARFATVVSELLAGLALLLASLGVYAVCAYAVAKRIREVGIRMALGAQRVDILRLIVREGMIPVALGIVIGLGLAIWLTPLIANLLFGVRPLDLATFGTDAMVLGAVGLVASYLPARRATRIDPMVALRYE